MKKILLIIFNTFLLYIYSYSQKQICSAVMPENKTTLDTFQMRGLADNYYLWNNRQKIYVKFLNGSSSLQNKIKAFATNCRKATVKYGTIVWDEETDIDPDRLYLESKL